MDSEILEKMPEWLRILRDAVKEYKDQEHDPSYQPNEKGEVRK